jgi:hypothetical protein
VGETGKNLFEVLGLMGSFEGVDGGEEGEDFFEGQDGVAKEEVKLQKRCNHGQSTKDEGRGRR